jgi:GNAT superfamily N-acetyltransferase
MLNRDDVFWHYDHDRKFLENPGYVHDIGPHISHDVSIHRAWRNQISWANFSSYHAEDIITDELDRLAQNPYLQNQELEWKVFARDEPFNLLTHLDDFEFGIGPETWFMALDTHQLSDFWLKQTPFNIKKVTNRVEVADYVAVEQAVWGENDAERWLRLLPHAQNYISLYVVYYDGAPVSCGRASFNPQSMFCGLWGGATLPEYRGYGFYLALVSARIQEAVKRNVRYVTIEAAETSRPILEKRGFTVLDSLWSCRRNLY